MSNNYRTAWMAGAIAVMLTGCSKTTEQPSATGTPANSAPAAVSDAAPPKAEAPAPPAPAKPQPITIAAGTPIKIRTLTTLSTKETQTGERFTANLAAPLVVDGKTVAPRGAQVEGRVVDSDPGGRVKGRATISVRLTQLRVGDRNVTIETRAIAREAHATKRKDAVKVGIGAGIGAAIGAIAGGGEGAAIGAASGGAAGTGLVLATHGDPAVIEAESVLTFKLSMPVTVEPI